MDLAWYVWAAWGVTVMAAFFIGYKWGRADEAKERRQRGL